MLYRKLIYQTCAQGNGAEQTTHQLETNFTKKAESKLKLNFLIKKFNKVGAAQSTNIGSTNSSNSTIQDMNDKLKLN